MSKGISREYLEIEKERLEKRLKEPNTPNELASLEGSLLSVKKFIRICESK